ncbi:uncharacterized protein LOC141826469 [Curcuma longa]|uniref:uncharacterized protein LOC141826469 n=1 Tax=Curcuma longa TaxID=136217 RepID=UPI003D9EC1E8
MIAGGATDGDSHRARKAHSRQLEVYGVTGGSQSTEPIIGFGPQDLEGVETPHDDALVIKATIANYEISRVFVDTDSSVNIIFMSAFKQMQIDMDDLEPMTTSLYGFTGNEVRPLGQIRLAISLGEEPARRTRYCFFTIVDASSSYNVILGRPTLGAFSAVVSTYHQKIKFPVGDLVAAELPFDLKQELAECLCRNQDVFAWDPANLKGVSPDVAMHRLNLLPGARPIK